MGVQILYLFKVLISFPLCVHPEEGLLDHTIVLFLRKQFLKERSNFEF